MLQKSNYLRHLDISILAATLILIIVGLLAIYSATLTNHPENFQKQLLWSILGVFIILPVIILTPLQFFYKYAYTIYGFTILLLFLVLIVGIGSGAKRWLSLGFVTIQPAELAKIGTLLALAKFLSHEKVNFKRIRDFIIPFFLILLPLGLIISQPDLGTSLVFLALLLPMLFWAGLSSLYLFIMLAPVLSFISAFNYYSFLFTMIVICPVLFFAQRGIRFFLINFVINIVAGIFTPILWNSLKGYQQKRILTFLGIMTDPHGLNYQVIQSKVAIGSGGFWGKGFLQGTQTHLRFLPEQHTDFIFSVIGEEFGLIGAIFILALFLLILWRSINLASIVKSRFSSLLIVGGMVILVFQIFVNVGMTVGILPVTGLPLPFLSYGGSSLMTNLTIIGLILNASYRKFVYL